MTTLSAPVMVFHVPFSLNPASTSASGIRPVKMRRAFEEAGYEVLEVSGNHEQRRRQIKKLSRQIAAGLRPDFVYSESATTPTGLGEKVTRHTSWSRDIRFLRFCRKKRIPVGLFYRDIYWVFPSFRDSLPRALYSLMVSRYKADLRGYKKGVDVLFIPSEGMIDFIPLRGNAKYHPLPSGTEVTESEISGKDVSVIYVGGIGDNYRMQEAFIGTETAVSHGARVSFTVCTREEEWEREKETYASAYGDCVSVVHKSGADLEVIFDESAVGSLFVEPSQYRNFAVPMKLFDYIGHGLAVIASDGTLAAEIVREWGIGWTIPYSAEAWSTLLERLYTKPEELAEKRRTVLRVAAKQRWVDRAREVARVLGCVYNDAHVD